MNIQQCVKMTKVKLADYNNNLMCHFFSLLSMHFIFVCLMFITTHIAVRVCHAKLKSYLFIYFL